MNIDIEFHISCKMYKMMCIQYMYTKDQRPLFHEAMKIVNTGGILSTVNQEELCEIYRRRL